MEEYTSLRCPHCGRTLMFEDSVCPYCGEELHRVIRKQKTTGGLFRSRSTLNPTQDQSRAYPGTGEKTYAELLYREKPVKTGGRRKLPILGLLIALVVAFWLAKLAFSGLLAGMEEQAIENLPLPTVETVRPTEPPMPQGPVTVKAYYGFSWEEMGAVDSEALYRNPSRWEDQGWDLSRREWDALEMVANQVRTWHDSRADLTENLGRRGYRKKRVDQALELLDIDFRVQAQKAMLSYLSNSYFGPVEIRNQLDYEKFTPEEIDYAMEYTLVDWDEQMQNRCRMLLEAGDFSRWGLIQRLTEMGFGEKDTEAYVDSLGLDWKESAVETGRKFLEFLENRNDLVTWLEEEGYTYEESVYAADLLMP